MSTRCHIHFCFDGEACSNIYKHFDGYPDGDNGVPAHLARFFEAVEADTKDTRFDHPEYLAAKYIVWHSLQRRGRDGPLSFLGIGVRLADTCDADYIYEVHCDSLARSGRPAISWQRGSDAREERRTP